jgi:hypothetical protein
VREQMACPEAFARRLSIFEGLLPPLPYGLVGYCCSVASE